MVGQSSQTLGRLTGLGRPLDPSPDEGRSLLRRELLHPRYNDQDLLDRLLNEIQRRISGGINAASNIGALSTFVAMLVLVALLVALGLLLSRAQRTATADNRARAVLTEEVVTAAELRRRAETALSEGRYGESVVEGFRALAVRQVERGRLQDSPGTTAHEVSLALAETYPHQRARVDRSAALFDAVLYGDRSATHGQAVDLLSLDDEMAGVR